MDYNIIMYIDALVHVDRMPLVFVYVYLVVLRVVTEISVVNNRQIVTICIFA